MKLLPSSGVRCTRGHRQRVVGPLISGPHSAAMPEARALLSRMEVSPPNLQPRSRLLATEAWLPFHTVLAVPRHVLGAT